jgi:hypothetical protein
MAVDPIHVNEIDSENGSVPSKNQHLIQIINPFHPLADIGQQFIRNGVYG